MVSSLKITKLNANNNNVHTDNRQKVNVFYDDNMVSVKNNGASNGNKANNNKDNNIKSYVNGDVRLNKDGSIRKKPGPKTGKILLNSMVKSNSQTKVAQNEISSIVQRRKEKDRLSEEVEYEIIKEGEEIISRIIKDNEGKDDKFSEHINFLEIKEKLAKAQRIEKELTDKFASISQQNARYEAMCNEYALQEERNKVDRNKSQHLMQTLELKENQLQEMRQKLSQFKPNQANDEFTYNILTNSTKNLNATISPKTDVAPDIGGYKLKISKFLGGENEDYDVWWEDLQAYFVLFPNMTEKTKIGLYNAHLGGEARKFIQNEDLSRMDTVNKLHQLLRGTFSDKYDWQNVLMNICQKPDEKIRPFSVRLRVAARKCGFTNEMLDNMCVNYLKRSCASYLKKLINNCLPNTPYDVIVEHAIQFERSQELDNNQKKFIKRKANEIDLTDDTSSDMEFSNAKMRKENEKLKNDLGNTIKQLKDSFGTKLSRLETENKLLHETVNNMTIENSSYSQYSNQLPRFSSNGLNRSNYYNNNHQNNSNKHNNKRLNNDNSYNNSNNCNNNNSNSNQNRGNNRNDSSFNACLHCAKPNHKYYDCGSATDSDIDAIRKLLREKKFDFAKHKEKVERVANEKRVRFNLASLNSESSEQP